MKILIKESGKRGFVIPLPFWIIRMGLSAPIIKAATSNIPKEQRKYIDAIDFWALSGCIGDLKKYRGLQLVNVKSKNGDEVKVIV